jgi:hypothetical protein
MVTSREVIIDGTTMGLGTDVSIDPDPKLKVVETFDGDKLYGKPNPSGTVKIERIRLDDAVQESWLIDIKETMTTQHRDIILVDTYNDTRSQTLLKNCLLDKDGLTWKVGEPTADKMEFKYEKKIENFK